MVNRKSLQTFLSTRLIVLKNVTSNDKTAWSTAYDSLSLIPHLLLQPSLDCISLVPLMLWPTVVSVTHDKDLTPNGPEIA